MPQVSYFVARVNNYSITGSDAIDLIMQSTVTHDPGVGMAPPTPKAHPPHSHAHISKEGFEATPIVPLSAPEKLTYAALQGKPAIKLTGSEKDKLAEFDRRTNNLNPFAKEGMHLDPATRGGYANQMQEVVDGGTLYIDRKLHSQFEDSEVAAMALVYALNTPAGKDALGHLKVAGDRAVLHSISAANSLNAGPVAMKNAPAVLSAHPLRNQTTEVVLRGKGAAGAAVPAIQAKVALPATMAIAATTLVLQNENGTDLSIVTHYPSHQIPSACYKNGGAWAAVTKKGAPAKAPIIMDTVEFSTGGALIDGKTYAAVKGAAKMTWQIEAPKLDLHFTKVNGVNSSGLACITCGQIHGATPSLFNKWFQCNKCGSAYCPTHVATLNAAVGGNKQCKSSSCAGGVASWIY